jgi:hypothetical protein
MTWDFQFKVNYMKKLVFAIFVILMASCEWILRPGPCDDTGPMIVYKTRNDYSNNVTVLLSKDGTKVSAYPGPSDASNQRPIQLAKGYLLKRMVGDAVLSLTIDEYSKSTTHYSPTELYNLIIDKTPYTEKYECCKCSDGDTASLNQLIRNNQLSKCETK